MVYLARSFSAFVFVSLSVIRPLSKPHCFLGITRTVRPRDTRDSGNFDSFLRILQVLILVGIAKEVSRGDSSAAQRTGNFS